MRVVLASNNDNKLREINNYFQKTSITLISQRELKLHEIEETAPSFVENAILKARHASINSGLPAIADDTGLEVDALNGSPGIFSARYSGKNANSINNIAKLLHELHTIPEQQRTARFQCIIVYLRHPHDPTPIICQGTWEGRILFAPQGENGFGYDPIFFVPTHNCSAAELPLEIKNQISHRAQALAKLISIFTT